MSYLKKIQLKTRFLISLLVFSLLFSVIHIAYGISANEYTVGKIEWPYKCHPLIFNTATIRVIDPDMNLDVKLQDTFDIQIWSDFDLREEYSGKIMTLTLQETGNSTGIFDGIIFWGNPWDDSLGHRIPIWDGNTVTARYTDHTIPSNFSESKLEITNSIAIKDIKPVMKTENGTTTAWVIYEPCTLEIFEQKNVSLAEKTEFVFPPPLKQINSGIPYNEIKCKESMILLQKYDGSPVCVTPETKQKLVERGWVTDKTEFWKSTSDWNSMRLMRNSDNLYCNSVNEESSVQCYPLDEIVFGNGNKRTETGWKLYPGGAGWTLPENHTLTPIYKKGDFGIPPLNFTAMLDDKIFVNKCESNGGVWNYTYHDCENLWQVCRDAGGIMIQENVTPPCTDTGIIEDDPLTVNVCRGAGIIRVSCIFEYED